MRSNPPMRSGVMLAITLALAAPAAAQQRQSDVAVPPSMFWRTMGDTTLDRLVNQTLEANPDIRAADARVREARATRVESALDLAPRVTAAGGYSRQRLASAGFPGATGSLPDQGLWDAGVQMSWELDLFGRLRRSLQGRTALVSAAEHDERGVQVVLAAEMAGAYFDLRGAYDRLAVARRNAENQRRTLDLTRDRLDAGSGTALDTERAQSQLSSTLAEIPVLEAEADAARHRIAVLLGRPPASMAGELDESGALPPLPADLARDNLEAAIRDRPDVRSAERQLAARGAMAGAARADYLPRVSIDARAGYTAGAFDAIGNSGTARYTIGPVVSWPLFDLGRVKAGVDAARAAEAAAEARYEQTRLRALEEAETAFSAYDRARERLVHLEDAAAASERATELARLRFAEGGTDFLEVLDAERRQLEAQDRLSAGRIEATAWLVSVYRAVGGRLEATDNR